jgi:hypothetical protein
MDFVQTWSTTTTKYASIAANSDESNEKSNEYQFSNKTTVYVCQKEILRTKSIQLQKRSTISYQSAAINHSCFLAKYVWEDKK